MTYNPLRDQPFGVRQLLVGWITVIWEARQLNVMLLLYNTIY